MSGVNRRVVKRAGDIGDVLKLAAARAPEPLGYKYDQMIDGRELHYGEKARLLTLLRLSKPEENETRCAVAYIAAGIGLTEALPILKKELERELPPYVNCAFEFAVYYLENMGDKFDKRRQLEILLRMCESEEAGERRFAHLVITRANIKYGTVTSW
ncbi:hypothetical protein KKB44_05725 [Candidatus Micrarchaeota archaeon]|nr:hypothetical protein [Candidatus Micrarchaeota archaeon]